MTPFVRLATLCDFASGTGNPIDFTRFTSINPDLSLHVLRAPRGEWIGLLGAQRDRGGRHRQSDADAIRRRGRGRARARVAAGRAPAYGGSVRRAGETAVFASQTTSAIRDRSASRPIRARAPQEGDVAPRAHRARPTVLNHHHLARRAPRASRPAGELEVSVEHVDHRRTRHGVLARPSYPRPPPRAPPAAAPVFSRVIAWRPCSAYSRSSRSERTDSASENGWNHSGSSRAPRRGPVALVELSGAADRSAAQHARAAAAAAIRRRSAHECGGQQPAPAPSPRADRSTRTTLDRSAHSSSRGARRTPRSPGTSA